MTWYGEVASKVDCLPLDPYSSLMNHLLGAIFEADARAGRPALTSIVAHKYGDKEPGKGFTKWRVRLATRSVSHTFSGRARFKKCSDSMGVRHVS